MHFVALAAVVAITVIPVAGSAQATQPATTTPAQHSSGTIVSGTYDLEITFGGGVMPGTLVVTTIGDSTAARLLVGDHAPPIKSVTRKGSQLTLAGSGDGIDVRYDFQFSGDALVGKFTFNGDPGTVSGKRRN